MTSSHQVDVLELELERRRQYKLDFSPFSPFSLGGIFPSHLSLQGFTLPNSPARSRATKVKTRYLRGLVRGLVADQIAQLDAAEQVSFYVRTSKHIWFKGTLGYIFEKFVYAWLHSNPDGSRLLCTAANAPDSENLYLRPPGSRKVMTLSDTALKQAKKFGIPFGLIPYSQSFPSLDAIVCTEDHIITIQATVASTHSTKEQGFLMVKNNLPVRFRRNREWCHLFITDLADTADALRRTHSEVLDNMGIRIYTAVLDVAALNFTREELNDSGKPTGSERGTDAETGSEAT